MKSNAYMLSMTGVEVHDNEDEDDSTKAMRPPTRSRPRCFAVRQCSHCHHQSLVMMLMMLMTMITMVMWQLWSFMMAMMIMMTMMSNIQDLFFWSCCHPMLDFSKNSNLDMHELLWNLNAAMIFDAEEKYDNHHHRQSLMIAFLQLNSSRGVLQRRATLVCLESRLEHQ